MLDRRRLEIALNNGSLGMLADDVVVALIHYGARRRLSDRDRVSVEKAAAILSAVTQMSGRELATGAVLRTMAPLSALNETFEQVTNASALSAEEFTETIKRYVDILRGVLSNSASRQDAIAVRDLFERLAQLTLVRSDDIVRPSRDEQEQWTNRALTF